MPKLRFHWFILGADALETAAHFEIHLKEFCAKENISPFDTWVKPEGGRHIVTMECDKQHLTLVRDRLKPQKGELVHD